MAKVDQRYQSSITLQGPKGKGGDLVRAIQHIIYAWIVRSERKLFAGSGCRLNKSFYESIVTRSVKKRVSSVEASVYYSEGEAAWCMCYSHVDSAVRGVEWVTEVGLRLDKNRDTVIMSTVLSTRTTGEVILRSEGRSEWRSTVPIFVRMALRERMIESVSMSGIRLPMSTDLVDKRHGRPTGEFNWINWVRKESDAKKVSEIIKSPLRRFAVILVMGETEHARREALDLAFGLFGKSYVCLVKYDHAVFRSFAEFEVPFDHVKVLLPFHKRDNNDRHPIYAVTEDGAHQESRERVVESQVGYVTSFEEGAVYRQEDVVALNRMAFFKRKNEDFKRVVAKKNVSEKEAAEMLEYAEAIQRDYEDEKAEVARLQKKCDDYTIEIEGIKDEAQQRLNCMEQKYNGLLRKKGQSMILPSCFPERIEGLRAWVGCLSNLAIDDRAWDGMADRADRDTLAETWTMLWHLNTTMHKIRFEETGAEIRTAFKERSGYTYTADENNDVKARWPEGHRAVIDGKAFMCWRHIKRGNDNSKLVRIYFDFDVDKARIVISWIGSHLRTNLTAGR